MQADLIKSLRGDNVTDLNELELDALTEVFNMAVGKAAASLSEMAGEAVLLSVPSVVFANHAGVSEIFGIDGERTVCGVWQSFAGEFDSDAILIFPEEGSLEIVRLFLGDQFAATELTDMAQETMSEIGNIMLNSCISAVGEIFSLRFDSSLPSVRTGQFASLLRDGATDDDDTLLVLRIEFELAHRRVTGYIVFLLDVPSMQHLAEALRKFIGNLAEDGHG